MHGQPHDRFGFYVYFRVSSWEGSASLFARKPKQNRVLSAKGPTNCQQNGVFSWFCFEVRSKHKKATIYCRPFAATRQKTTLTRRGTRRPEIFEFWCQYRRLRAVCNVPTVRAAVRYSADSRRHGQRLNMTSAIVPIVVPSNHNNAIFTMSHVAPHVTTQVRVFVTRNYKTVPQFTCFLSSRTDRYRMQWAQFEAKSTGTQLALEPAQFATLSRNSRHFVIWKESECLV